MRLLTYNILQGGTGRIDPLAEVIRLADADIVALQETWDAELFHKLADRLHMDRFLAENPRNPEGATGLLTRGNIRQVVNHAPRETRLARSAFTAVVEVGVPWNIVGLHLPAGQGVEDEAQRLMEIPAIMQIASTLPGGHILCGDFNSVHPQQAVDVSRLREKVRQRIAPQRDKIPRDVVAAVLAAGYVDAHGVGREAEAFEVSFPTSKPALRVDYVFVTPELLRGLRQCRPFVPEMARFASDHFPWLAEWE